MPCAAREGVRIRLYFDEDTVQHTLVSALRKRGIDVLTALEAKMLKTPDERLRWNSRQPRRA